MVPNRSRILKWISRQINHRDLRKGRTDLLTLERIVIQKGQTLDADVQFGSNLAQTLHFVIPTDTHGGKMFRAQQHARMLFQYLYRFVRIIPAADG